MSELSEKIAALSPEQRALFDLKMKALKAQKRQAAKPESPKIVRRVVNEPIPLSLDQERLWFINQFAPDNAAYNIHTATRFRGPLDVAVLEQSLNEVIQRHDVLRTCFIADNGQPKQVIAPTLNYQIPVIDLQELSQTEQEAEVMRYATEEAEAPFDLAQAPLLRVWLLKLSPTEYVIYFNQHHIITDWWSTQLLFQELAAFYEGLLSGQRPVLPEPYQYADFVLWERERVESQDMERSLAYWRQHLAEGTFKLDLPVAKRRPAEQTFVGRRQWVTIPPALVQDLKAFSRRENVTLFMTLTAAFKLLLFRYTGQTDITLGTPLANRSQVELENVLGFLITMLVLHTELSGDLSFKALVHKVRQVILEAYAHQDVPFAKLLEIVQPERDWSRNPIFQFSFIFLDEAGQAEDFKSLEVDPLFYDPQVSRFDLTLIAEDHGEEIICYFEYNNALFDADSMARFADHLRTLMENMVAAPDQPIAQLPILTAPEREQILAEWNDTQVDYLQGQCLHHLFEAQAERTPESVALMFDAEPVDPVTLTYRELNERANQLAHYLIQQGVGPDTLVGICAERSIEMVVGLYGILKAGGAYVPLDPTYPRERLAFMMADAQVPVLLTQAHLHEQLPAHEAQTVCLDADWDRVIAHMPTNIPPTGAQAEHLAYVIYTSGSTGQPKGAANAHCGVVNRLLWMQDEYRLTSDDRVLQKTPFSFDVSVWEFFWPLFNGARLVIAQPEGHKDPSYLVSAIRRHRITTLHFVPPMLSLFLESPTVETCDTLQRVICSGQALPYELERRFFAKLDAELHNLYGPTEAAIDVTYWACQPENERDLVPIGRPVANTQIYLLDEAMAPVPIGLPGELHIGGIQVARGYHNRPELTQEKFIDNPLGAGRLYKTGDLARWLPDGSIEFIGRIDDQTKLRGFRIELGEIETVLNAHPAVQETVAVVREEANDQQLVAYVVPDAEAAYPVRQQLHLVRDGAVTEEQTSYELPNGMTVYYRNKGETDFMYREIFEDHCYLRHGIHLPEGSCVFDVGANVGLFSLFAHRECPDVNVYAFEPVPDIFALLRLNTSLYGVNVHLMEGGLASTNKQDSFTYYPHVSILSGRFADAAAEQEVVRTFLMNEDTEGIPEALLQEMLDERLTSQRITCEFKTLSTAMREHRIETIDLLKVDVEKSELDILQGIEAQDWPKIKQMVLEVHDDAEGSFQTVTDLLDAHGFEYVIEQEEMLKDTNLYSIYAKQSDFGQLAQPAVISAAANTWSSAGQLTDDLREFLQKKLPEYMIPTAFVMLDGLRLTPNGKVDRGALPAPDRSQAQASYVPPETPTEETLAGIWTELLGLDQVGRHDDFFKLGGHSLLATQVILQVGHTFEVELPLRQLLNHPTLSELAQQIDSTRHTLAGLQDMTTIRDDEAEEREELVL